MCTPHWGCSGEHAYWRRLLNQMTLGRVQLPDDHIYVPGDSDTAMQAPERASFFSMVNGSLNLVPLSVWIRCYSKRSYPKIVAWPFPISKKDLLSTYPPHLQGVNPLMAIRNLLL